uniref:Gasdermin B n=1 Tax=Microcebus murinus TaxID=30608 RepID=A0A8C5Y4Y8_MICMU
MPSMFEGCTRTVVQEMDPGGDMIPVRSALDADRFCCFWLVREKRDLTLMDILETEEGEGPCDELDSGLQGQKAEFQILDTVDSTGKLTVKLLEEISIAGELQGSHEQKIKILKNQISQQYLETLVNRQLKKKLPPSFQSLHTRREDLHLVTETLETVNKETLKSKWQYGFLSQIYQALHLNYGKVTIPSNQVLDYRLKQLIFPNEKEMSIYFWGKTKSFPEGESKACWAVSIGKSLSSEDSRNMKEKVHDTVRSLQDLTEKEQRDVLSSLTKCLSKDEHLEDLEQRVFEALKSRALQMEGSAGPLLSSLFNTVGSLVDGRAKAILDFLDALGELSEKKQLVSEALEKGILPLLKDEVKSGMEKVWDKQASNPHDMTHDPELSSEPTSASS